MFSCPRHVTRLACFEGTLARYRGVYKMCGHTATVWFNSATLVQLIIPGHDYSGDTTQQDSTTALAMFSAAE
jgi:hypothetical protein